MKKLSKFAAVVAAMALLMAMSTSAFAAVSPSDPLQGSVDSGLVLTDSNDDEIRCDIVGEPIQKLDEADAQAIVEEKLHITVDADKVVVFGSANLKLVNVENGENVTLADGQKVEFTIDVSGFDLEEGTTVYVIHKYGPGENDWEVVPCDVDGDGCITVELTGLSPVYLALMEQIMNAGDDPVTDTPNNTDKPADKPAANTTKVSPKTGF